MDVPKTLRPISRSADDIAAELRREFLTTLYARRGVQAQPDPVLETVFHALAVQIDRLYEEADQVFWTAALDELIRGLGMPARLAQPSQTVVKFSAIEQREALPAETELIGFQATGDQVNFTLDEPFDVAPLELSFAAVAEGSRLEVLQGARVPGPSGPIPITSGFAPLGRQQPAPTIFLAIEADEGHLGQIGLAIETLPPQGAVAAALSRSPWQLLDDSGHVSEAGVLRPARGRGGIQRLRWFIDSGSSAPEPGEIARTLVLRDGVYGSRVWLFPEVPASRRWRCNIPPVLQGVASRLLPDGAGNALDRPLVWVQIPLPAGIRGVASAVQRIDLNAMTASNGEILNEQVEFNRMGTVVAHRPEGSLDRHLMGVLSVTGESGTAYVDASDLESPDTTGRYRYRGQGLFELRPARQPSGRYDQYAALRLLFCDGQKANGLDVGQLRRIVSSLRNVTAQVTNLTVSRAGSDPPGYAAARLRFAELLRTRERIVTAGDIEIAARAFEPRLRDVEVVSASEITERGLDVVALVTVVAAREDFADPDAEIVRMREQLEGCLQERLMLGHEVRVVVRERS